MKQPSDFPSVADVQVFEARGPWDTKSGGELKVLFALPLTTLLDCYLKYKPSDLEPDIRGLRVYTVGNLPKGRIGGTEWHRLRQEIVFGMSGAVRWTCEDLSGDKREFLIDCQRGIWMPPSILHTYEVIEEGSSLLVVANTLFVPGDPETHDTYSAEMFREALSGIE